MILHFNRGTEKGIDSNRMDVYKRFYNILRNIRYNRYNSRADRRIKYFLSVLHSRATCTFCIEFCSLIFFPALFRMRNEFYADTADMRGHLRLIFEKYGSRSTVGDLYSRNGFTYVRPILIEPDNYCFVVVRRIRGALRERKF